MKDTIKKTIEHYTGEKVSSIKIKKDPQVPGAYGIRVEIEGEIFDYLLTSQFSKSLKPEDLAEVLEECEFESWPPKSGSLLFS